jgi:[ribosomal protein S18]-alanine N-acetyltransferase
MSAVLQPRQGFEPMGEGDLAPVIEIEQRIYAFPWTLGNFRDSIRAGYSCWVCRGGEGLFGYAVLMLAAGEAHLLNLTIDSPFQKRGHGSRLLQHLVRTARDGRAHVLFLEVRPSNAAGLGLYARHGFRQIGVRRDYYPAQVGRENALVFALEF